MINYDRTFAEKHNVSAMLLYNQDQYNVNNPDDLIASLPKRKQGIAGRLTYAYDYRYLAEFNFGYNGSENFAEGHRFGFFPSLALGYTISREKWFEPLSDIITNLKIRGSWGLVGNDQIGGERYIYMSNIELQNGDLGFTTGKDQNTTYNGPKYLRYANNDITWEVGSKWNIGLDLSLFNDFNLTFDVFKEVRSDILCSVRAFRNLLVHRRLMSGWILRRVCMVIWVRWKTRVWISPLTTATNSTRILQCLSRVLLLMQPTKYWSMMSLTIVPIRICQGWDILSISLCFI